jgi:hypothetical protein
MIFSFDLNEFYKKIVQYSIKLKHSKTQQKALWLGRSQPGKQNKQPSFIDRSLVIIVIA